MTTVDNRVVELKFNNSQFENEAGRSLSTLDKLKNALNMKGAADGLKSLGNAVKDVRVESISEGVKNSVASFTMLASLATGMLTRIGSLAVDAGMKLWNSLVPTDKIMAGFAEYETKIGSIQTILANTARHGTGLKTVEASLDSLNTYADRTIYNFGDMTRNIGLFTNAGLRVEDATDMIKGFSNVAAASGTSAAGAAGAAYQLSQALSAGKIQLMDWRSLTNVGMGNKNMQDGLIQIATAMGTLKKGSKTASTAQKDFNSSLKDGWLSADVMSKYLKIMSADNIEAEMSTLKLTDAQKQMFRDQAQTAFDAATKVRSLTQLMETLQEAAGSGWAKSVEIVMGNFDEATELFTKISDEIGAMVDASADKRNQMLQQWSDWGGRSAIIDGLWSAFESGLSILNAVKASFATVFSSNGINWLVVASFRFKQLMEAIKPSEEALKTFQTNVTNVLRILKAVGSVIVGGVVGVFKVLGAALGVVASYFDFAIGGILKNWGAFKAGLGISGDAAKSIDWLQMLADVISYVAKKINEFRDIGLDYILDGLNSVSDTLASWKKFGTEIDFAGVKIDILNKAGQLLRGLFDELVGVFGGFKLSFNGVGDVLAKVKSAMQSFFGYVGPAVSNFIKSIKMPSGGGGGISGQVSTVMQGIADGFVKGFGGFGDSLKKIDMNKVFAIFNSAMLIAVLKNVKDIIGAFKDISETITQFASIGETINKTGAAMQRDFNAKALKSIVVSLLLFAGALWILSKIEVGNLETALSGMAVAIIELGAMMLILSKITLNPAKLITVGIALTAMAGAMAIMGLAMLIFSNMSWEDMAKGMTGFAAAAVIMVGMALGLDKVKGQIVAAAFGMQVFAVAMGMLAGALAIFGLIPVDVLIQGGIAMTSLLTILVAFGMATQAIDFVKMGAGLILIGIALNMMALPLVMLGLIPWPIIVQGMIALGAMLAGLGIALSLMQNQLQGAAAILALAIALNLLVIPIVALGLIPFEILVQGLLALVAVMALLVLAAQAMTTAIAGAGAMILFAVAIGLLAGSIILLGLIPLEVIVSGLVAFVAILGAVALASLMLAPAAPAMMAMAVAILAIGAAVLLAGIGMMLFAVGLGLLGASAVVGGAGIQVLANAVASIAVHIPAILAASVAFLALGAALIMVGIGIVVASAGILILSLAIMALAAGLLLLALSIPIAVAVFDVLIEGMKKFAQNAIELMIATGVLLALGAAALVAGAGTLALGIGMLAAALGLVAFFGAMFLGPPAITALENAMTRLANTAPVVAVAVLVLSQLKASVSDIAGPLVAASIGMSTAAFGILALGLAGKKGGDNVAEGMSRMTTSMASAQMAVAIFTSTIQASGAVATASLDKMANEVTVATDDILNEFQALAKLLPTSTQLIVMNINNMGTVIKGSLSSLASSVGSSAEQVGRNIIQGMARGMQNSSAIEAAARSAANKALKAARDTLGVRSPSKEFEKIGQFVNEGFAQGLLGSEDQIEKAFESLNDRIKDGMKTADDQIAQSQKNIAESNKKIAAIEKKSVRRRTAADKKTLAAEKEKLAKEKALLAEAENLRWRSYQAHDMVLAMQKNEQVQLQRLRVEYDEVSQSLADANKELEDAIKTRDDAAKNWGKTFGKLDDMSFGEEETLETYMDNLQKRYEATVAFHQDMKRLAELGVDDEIYEDLINKGLDAAPFVKALIEGGWGAVKNLNELNNKLDKESEDLGTTAAKQLYQAGVDAAQGLVDGLSSKQEEIGKQMESIADSLVNTIKWKLGIKSPSKVMKAIGGYTMKGFQAGVENMAPALRTTMNETAQRAMMEFRDTLNSLGEDISEDINSDFVITPVFDFSDIRSGVATLRRLAPDGITVDPRRAKATVSSLGTRAEGEDVLGTGGAPIQFIQNNNSPKALSSGEIYRQTKNQISRIRKELP